MDLTFTNHNQNKMKLELKHISPYLPYGLTCNVMGEQDENGNPILFNLFGANQDWAELEDISKQDPELHLIDQYYIYDCFPMLRPLSQLTEMMPNNGVSYVSYLWHEVIGTDSDCFSKDKFFDDCELGLIDHLPIMVYNKLCEFHFDIFGLINLGLALPIKD